MWKAIAHIFSLFGDQYNMPPLSANNNHSAKQLYELAEIVLLVSHISLLKIKYSWAAHQLGRQPLMSVKGERLSYNLGKMPDWANKRLYLLIMGCKDPYNWIIYRCLMSPMWYPRSMSTVSVDANTFLGHRWLWSEVKIYEFAYNY